MNSDSFDLRSGLRVLIRMTPLILAGNMVYFAASIVASRLLDESDYSVFVTQLAALSVLGTGAAGIQLDVVARVVNESVETTQSSRGYWLRLVAVSVALSLVVLLSLPQLAKSWNVDVRQIVWFAVGPMIVVQSAFVQGKLQGRRLFGYFYALVALLGAWRILSLVWGQVLDYPIGSTIGVLNVGSLLIASLFLVVSGGVVMQSSIFLSPKLLLFTIGSIAVNALLYADVFLARSMSDVELGGFLAASTLVKALLVLPVLLTQIFFPDFANLAAVTGLKARMARRLLLLVATVTVVGATAFVLSAEFIVPMIYGADRAVSRGTAFWLAVGVVPSALLLVVVSVLLAHQSRKAVAVLAAWVTGHFVVVPFLATSVRELAVVNSLSFLATIIAVAWAEFRFLFGGDRASSALKTDG
jgi:O-antigen/teichoic acid export membrane protein